MKVTEEMVYRFLSWKLPESFRPDCYVEFDRERAKENRLWPVGTNILSFEEARAMLEHVLSTKMQPTYYVQHPDGSYSEAEPQPTLGR